MAPTVISGVPAYTWHHGCGPTAAGMVVGYWDTHGFGALVPGDASTQTTDVNEMIASEGPASNYTDYCLPLDYAPDPIQPDLSEPPAGDEHPDECVADYMFTSQSASNNYYGWSWFSRVAPAVQNYVSALGAGYSVSTQNLYMGSSLNWDSYRAEIDAGRPLVFLVDTDGNGGTDHFVTAIGYDVVASEQRYGCLNTWDSSVHWYEFAPMASGQAWGIYGATAFEFSGAVGPLVHEAYVVDDDMVNESVGNGDGIVNCGETIELYVDLRNQGSGAAVGVHATIATSDPYVTFLFNTSSSYPDIAGGATERNGDDFDFQVNPATPNGHVIDFEFNVTASNGGPWSAPFSVPVVCGAAPDIDVTPGSLEVTLAPGQSTNRTLTIHNLGGAPLEFEISEQDTTSVSAWLGPDARSEEEIALLKADASPSGQNAGGPPSVSPFGAPAFAQLSGTVQMLAWVRYTDYDQEYANTLAAIGQYFSSFTLAESSTLDPAVLAAELAGKDVLLLPEPEEGTTVDLEAAGSAFQATLQSFVSSGGGVVATCEWGPWQGFLRSAALLDAHYASGWYSGDLTVVDPGHPVAAGLGATVQAANATASYTIGDLDVQVVMVDPNTDPVVAARDIGAGHVALIGYDYYEYNDDAARIVANAVQWAAVSADVPWLSEDPITGTVAAGGSQEVMVTFDAAGLSAGTYTANLIIANNDPDENPVTVPVTLHVIGDPYEPNDDPAHATSIHCSDVISASIDPAGDVDYFQFSGSAGTTIIADIDASINGSSLDSVLTLFDSDGVTVLAENDDYYSLDSRIEYTLPHGGTFYLRVQDYGTPHGGPGYFYALSLECLVPPDIDVTPASFWVTLPPGQSTNRTLSIDNTGAGMLGFSITDRETGHPGAGLALEFMSYTTLPEGGNNLQVAAKGDRQAAAYRYAGARPALEFVSYSTLPQGGDNLNPAVHDAAPEAGHPQAAAYRCAGALDTLDILVYADDAGASAGSTYVEQALQSLGYAYTGYYADYDGFGAALGSLAWDLVIVSHANYYGLGNYWSELEDHFNSGGKLIIATFDIDGSDSEATTLWNTLGLSYNSDLSSVADVYEWDSGHPVWAGVPDLTTWSEMYFDNGDRIDALSGCRATGGFSASPTAGEAAIVVRDDRGAIVNSFIPDEHRSDDDGDGVLDTVELWRNEITYLLGGGILLYADDSGTSAGSTYVERALQGLGLPYTGYYADHAGFGTALVHSAWDLVIVSHANQFELGNYWSELEDHFNSGGKLIVATFDIDGSHSEATTLWNTLGLSYNSDLSSVANVYQWDSGHPVWAGVPDFTTWSGMYIDNGDRVNVLGGSAAIGGFSPSPAAGEAAIVVRDDGRAIVNSFIPDEHRSDDDGDGMSDTVELWRNEISYVLGLDAPWLTETPAWGSVPAGGGQNVTLTFDASGLSAGTYEAVVVIASNDPDENPVMVPVTLLVNHPPQVGAVTPSSGSGPVGVTTYFSTTWRDADGWQDLKQCYFHIGDSPSLVGNVTLMYNNVKDKLWLLDDSGTTWTGGFAPGSANVLENSQAIVHCSLTTTNRWGTTRRVKWAIQFKPGYTGAKKTGLKCKDIHKARAKAKWKGTWTIY